MEHIPVPVKQEDVAKITISGLACSEGGIVFLADKTRGVVYSVDINNCSSFSFGLGKLSKFLYYQAQIKPSQAGLNEP